MNGQDTTPVLGKTFYSRAAELSQMVNLIRADINDSHCDHGYRPKNSSMFVIIPGGYEGIPQNLCINFVAWIVCKFKFQGFSDKWLISPFFLILVPYNPLLSSEEKCLELWQNGITSKKRKEVTNL